MSPPPPRLAVFDFDGTLADSRRAIVVAMDAALAAAGAPPPDAAVQPEWIGLPLPAMLAYLLPAAPAAARATAQAAFVTHYPRACDAHVVLFDGIREVLAAARRRGVWLAIATNKGRAALDHTLAGLGLVDTFLASRTVDEVRHSKPHPEMLLGLLTELGVSAADAAMVGDTTYDVEMAAAAGVRAVGCAYGAHGEARLRGAGATVVVHRAAQLLGALGLEAG